MKIKLLFSCALLIVVPQAKGMELSTVINNAQPNQQASSLVECSLDAIIKNIDYLKRTKPNIIENLCNEGCSFGPLLKQKLFKAINFTECQKKIPFEKELWSLAMLDAAHKIIAVGDEEGTIHIYDLAADTIIKSFSYAKGLLKGICDIQILNSDEIITSTRDSKIVRWNWKTGTHDLVGHLKSKDFGGNVCKLCTINNQTVASYCLSDREIRIWNLETKKSLKKYSSEKQINGMQRLSDTKLGIFGQKYLQVLNVTTLSNKNIDYMDKSFDWMNIEKKLSSPFLDGCLFSCVNFGSSNPLQVNQSLRQSLENGCFALTMGVPSYITVVLKGIRRKLNENESGHNTYKLVKLDDHHLIAASEDGMVRILGIPETYSLKELLMLIKSKQEKV